MSLQPVELQLQRLQAEQALILDRVDNAIALFDDSHRLILFNQKLSQIWDIDAAWIQTQPSYEEVLAEVIRRGYWTQEQGQELEQVLQQAGMESVSFTLMQVNNIHLEVYVTATSEGGRLLVVRDVTRERQSQTDLNNEVRRLKFLLGLTERLQTSGNLQEIGQFAIGYLMHSMGAAFGDVKVINGNGSERWAGTLTNQVSSQFIAIYGVPAVQEMQEALDRGIPYGQGLIWQVVETGKPMFVEDYANHPQAVPAFRHPAIGQLGIFPIPSTNSTIIGVLTLESRTAQKLQEAPQQDILLAACQTLGAAIERAQSQERLKQANQDLERASRLKSEFLAAMSHELRTPLNSILGFSDLLSRQSGGTLTQRQLNHVQAIETSGQHLLQLINDILDLSKVEAGKVELDLQSVSLQNLCHECLKMIQPRVNKKRIALSLELDYRLSQVVLDERRVRQMLINLLSNAVKFTPEQGQIKLKVRLGYGSELLQEVVRPDDSPANPSTPYLCLEVSDSGIGIPTDRQHLLFLPFQQIDSSLSRKHEGTGLGLALTKRLAELHGGTISLTSQEGQGSTFRIWLPLTEMRQALTQPAGPVQPVPVTISPSPAVAISRRIMVVEDQMYNQILICELLELEGYSVELIGDGQSMSEAINSQRVPGQDLPNLILMDIQLPGVDGLELIRQLKAHPLWRSIPVIAITAMAMAGDRDRCFDAGADAYLSKPLNINETLRQIHLLVSGQ